MKKTKKRALYIIAALLAALFVLSCLVGFAACGDSDDDNQKKEEVVPGGDEGGDSGNNPSHTHSYTSSVTKEATCTEKGVKTYVCSCGDSYTEEVAALGHDWGTGVVTPATCTEGGYTTQTCQREGCNETQKVDETQALGHTYGNPEYVAATQNAEAHWTQTCSACSDVVTLTSGEGLTFEVSDEAMLKSAATLDGATIVLTVEEATTPIDGNDGDDDEEFAADIELTSTLTIDKTITLDLNGHTLGYPEPAEEKDEDEDEEESDEEVEAEPATSDDVITVTESGSLTIEDGTAKNENEYGFTYGTGAVLCTYPTANSANNKAAIRTAGEVVIESGIVYSTSVGIHAIAGSVEINDGVVYDTSYYVMWEGDGVVDVTINGGIVAGAKSGILVDGDSNFGHVGTAESPNGYQYGAVNTLTVTGGEVYSGGVSQPAIRTELQSGPDTAIIKISGGKIICDVDTARTERMCAVFLANGTLEISGGTITGPTAVEIQAGKATISGGTFVATGNNQTKKITGSDPFSYGYALAIIATGNIARNNHDSDNFPDMTVDVDVTGGAYVGDIYVSAETARYYDTTVGSSILVSDMSDEQRQKYKDYIWAVSFERDTTGQTTQNYVVTMDAITLTPYDSSNNEVTDEQSQTVAYYLWTSRVSAVKENDDRLKVDGTLAFDASDITVAYDLTTNTYTISGTSTAMGQQLGEAVYGTGHGECQYITFEVVANEGETINITTYNGETLEKTWVLFGTDTESKSTTDGTFVLDLTDHTEGEWKMVIEVTNADNTTATYTVVIGTITPTVTETPAT